MQTTTTWKSLKFISFCVLVCRSYDRDEVLGHVKQHYIDAGLFVSPVAPSSTPPLINIPMPPQLQKIPTPEHLDGPRMVSNLLDIMPNITIKPPSLSVMPNGEPSGVGIVNNNVISSPSCSSSTAATTTALFTFNLSPSSALNTNSSLLSASSVIGTSVTASALTMGSGSGSNTSNIGGQSGGSNTTNTAVNNNNPNNNNNNASTTTTSGGSGWRGPAPYRCGHCHQVSNWKHVIQVFY